MIFTVVLSSSVNLEFIIHQILTINSYYDTLKFMLSYFVFAKLNVIFHIFFSYRVQPFIN